MFPVRTAFSPSDGACVHVIGKETLSEHGTSDQFLILIYHHISTSPGSVFSLLLPAMFKSENTFFSGLTFSRSILKSLKLKTKCLFIVTILKVF